MSSSYLILWFSFGVLDPSDSCNLDSLSLAGIPDDCLAVVHASVSPPPVA